MSFECGSLDGSLNTSIVKMSELMKSSWCSNLNAGLIWDITAARFGSDSPLVLLSLKMKKQGEKLPKKPLEGNLPTDGMESSTGLAASCGLERHVCGTGHCSETPANSIAS